MGDDNGVKIKVDAELIKKMACEVCTAKCPNYKCPHADSDCIDCVIDITTRNAEIAISKMDAKEKLTEDEYDAIATEHWEYGKAAMLGELAKEYRKEAGDMFAYGHDNDAQLFRSLAKGLENRENDTRKKLNEKYRPEQVK